MAKKDHADIPEDSKLCGERPDGACKCGKNYYKLAQGKPTWNGTAEDGWTKDSDLRFKQKRLKKGVKKAKKGKKKVADDYIIIPAGWQAHHVVPCATLKYMPDDAENRDALIEIRDKTTWCINDEPNMVPMPIWGMTVKWYCNLPDEDIDVDANPDLKAEDVVTAPPFVNIPQHDWEHNTKEGYNYEVKQEVYEIWQVAAEECEGDPYEDAAGQLEGLSTAWTTTLKDRGMRKGGTHEAWVKALDGDDDGWYLPFSMGSDGEAARRHFAFSFNKNKIWRKFKQLLQSLATEAAQAV